MDSAEVGLEAQIDALREQQLALEAQLGFPAGQSHHGFHDAAVHMITEQQQQGDDTTGAHHAAGAAPVTVNDVTDAELVAECESCCPRGCCPRCCLCRVCCVESTDSARPVPCECGCADCTRGTGDCRRRGGYTRYYYNAASQRDVVPLPCEGRQHTVRAPTTRNPRASSSRSTRATHVPFAARFSGGADATTTTTATAMSAAADALEDAEGLSLHARLAQIEAMRRKYSRAANRAMRDYQQSVSHHADYDAERRRRLRTARPFTFEARELMKPVRIHDVRMELDRRERERAEQAMRQHQFTARAVPATTFMNKYDVMVEEWCQRKLAVEMLAREKADRAKEEEAYVRESAQGLRRVREEMMGVRYDKHGKQITRSEAIRRAESADAARRRREATRPNEVPLEVQLTLWPALKEHEQVRKERLLHQAKQARTETDAFFRQTMPLLANPSEARVFNTQETLIAMATGATTTTTTTTTTYGIGQPVGVPMPTVNPSTTAMPTTTTAATALPVPTPDGTLPPPPPPPPPPAGVAVPLPLPGALPPPPPPMLSAMLPLPTTMPGAVPMPLDLSTSPATQPAGVLPPPPQAPPAGLPPAETLLATEVVLPTTPKARTAAVGAGGKPVDPFELQRRYNANLVFKPQVRPGVPNFERLWAEERVALQARKTRRPPTELKPFHLTHSEKENVVGKKRVMARSVPAVRTRSATTAGQQRTVTTSTSTTATTTTTTTKTATTAGGSTSTTEKTAVTGAGSSTAPPKGTRAHALRTQAVYRQYVERAKDGSQQRLVRAEANLSTAQSDPSDSSDPAVAAYWRGVAARRAEVRQRLATYLPVDPKLEHEEAIRSKVRSLRAAMKESETGSREKLEEMRARVAQMPPLFAEPTHLNDLSKARAEAERDILQMLKDTGLGPRTIHEVLVQKPAAAAAAAAAAATVGESDKPKEEAAGDAAPKEAHGSESESDKYSSSDFSSSSSSDDDSDDDDSSTGRRSGAEKKKSEYGDDDFESSSSDDSV